MKELNRKTLELLLLRYTEMNNSILKDSAEKQKFVKLIAEVELKLKNFISYPNNMTALEFAIKLAADANLKNNKE